MNETVSPYGPPWKLALIGGVAIIAGVALLFVDWTLPELVAFVAMFFVARGALHLVTASFEGVMGALAALQGGGEIAVGVVLLAWPDPTLLVLAVLVGTWVLVHAIVDGAIVLATRVERRRWLWRFAADVVEVALGAVLIARPGGAVSDTAVTLGVLAIVSGVVELGAAFAGTRAGRIERGEGARRRHVTVAS